MDRTLRKIAGLLIVLNVVMIGIVETMLDGQQISFKERTHIFGGVQIIARTEGPRCRF